MKVYLTNRVSTVPFGVKYNPPDIAKRIKLLKSVSKASKNPKFRAALTERIAELKRKSSL